MILAGGVGPEAIITADMLPQDVGSMVPAIADQQQWRAHHGAAAARGRGRCFERDYLIAQISRFSGNISRTAGIRRHGADRRCIASSRRWGSAETGRRFMQLLENIRSLSPRFRRFDTVFLRGGARTGLPKKRAAF